MAQEQQRAATGRRRAAWWVAGTFFALLAVVPQLILSIWGTRLLGEALTHALELPVSVQRVSGGWWGGLEIEGLTIFDGANADARKLLEVSQANLDVPIWMLIIPGGAVDVTIDRARVELRQLPSGHWNVAALQPDPDTQPPEKLLLPARELAFRLKRGQIYLESEDREYSLNANASSLSLRNQPLDWSIEIAAANGESLAAKGSFTNLAKPREISGSAKFELARLDLTVIAALVPQLPVMYPNGRVETGNAQVRLSGLERFHAQAVFEVRNISLPDSPEQTAVPLPQGAIHLAVTRDRAKWTFETLSIKGPHGHLTVAPGGWLDFKETGWQAHLEVRGQLDDAQPGSEAFAMLLPDPLRLRGALAVKANIEGTLNLDSHGDLHQRLAHVKASFAFTLAEAQWRKEQLKDIVARFHLNDGRLTISELGASVGKGQVTIQGGLALEGESGGTLSWIITDVELARTLGPPIRAFDIKKASGGVTFDSTMYHLESQTAVRELAFERQALDDRELRVTDGNLDCGGSVTADLAYFNIADCKLKAVQGDLSVPKGQIDLGDKPKLAVALKGWLGGPFLTALVPEFTPKWPRRLGVSGTLTVPFTDEIWRNMLWELDVKGKNFAYEDVNFNDLEARVTKSVGRLAFDIGGRRGAGSITTTGALVLGDKNITTLSIKAKQVPLQRKLTGSYSVSGTISGSADVTINAEGEEISFLNDLEQINLKDGSKTVAKLARGKLAGTLGRRRRGGLRAKELSLTSDELNLKVHDSTIPLAANTKEALKLNLDYTGTGHWLTLAGALGGADGVVATGNSLLSLRIQGQPGRTLASLQGKGNVEVARLSLWGHPTSDVNAAFELQPGEIKIIRGLLSYGTGKVALEGNVILPLERGDRKEHLVLQLQQVPVAHTQTFTSFKGGGPAKLTNKTVINGHVALDGAANGQLALSAELKTTPISRGLSRSKEELATAELPALHLKTKLLSRKPLQSWTVPSFDIRGTGVSIQLTDGRFRRKPAAYDIAATLAIEISPEFLEGLALGLIPTDIKPAGKVAAAGQANLQVPADVAIGLKNVEFRGTLETEKLIVNADTISAMRLAVSLAQGRLNIQEGEAGLLGGRIWLPNPATINLQGPAHVFNIHVAAKNLRLQAHGGRRVSLGRFLGLLIPVFLFTTDSNRPVSVKGVLQTDLQLQGTYQNLPGWSRSVNGEGSFRIDDGAVEGSSLISGIIARSVLLPTNVVHNAVATLFSKDGELGRALSGLGDRAFTFQTIASPITIRHGDILLKPGLKVSSPEMTLTINGHSNLEGKLDYDVGTDLIRRVRLGEITDLPNKIPLIGRAISFLNPFTYLDGIELRAKVTGNLLKTGPDGHPDVHVATSVVDTKKS